ncbi:hypothetical protein PHLCEN_2v398 [Hermanssonia centrifuga]|uniref:Large ribosomal subunit protein bL32m n=1 Tax=Hermanssonia centrifuga TaxID=98765 RepID=A0A2R6S622_9APHY|nr:hypothetical protein PHLCEN_2v398 [Hermanssonia centrifuga]
MASLALPVARSTFLGARMPMGRALFTSILPTFLTGWTLPQIFEELILRAVPKKKTSHSRKSMRSANKGLKDKRHLVLCPACGSPKLAHHLCANCYSSLNRSWKAKSKQEGGSYSGVPSVSMDS